MAFAHRLQELHFLEGRDYGDPETYRVVAAELDVELPDLSPLAAMDERHPKVAADFTEARRDGIRSFPTLTVLTDRGARRLPTEYDPDRLLATVRAALA